MCSSDLAGQSPPPVVLPPYRALLAGGRRRMASARKLPCAATWSCASRRVHVPLRVGSTRTLAGRLVPGGLTRARPPLRMFPLGPSIGRGRPLAPRRSRRRRRGPSRVRVVVREGTRLGFPLRRRLTPWMELRVPHPRRGLVRPGLRRRLGLALLHDTSASTVGSSATSALSALSRRAACGVGILVIASRLAPCRRPH